MNYTLKVTETNRKSGKYLYEITDESGNIYTKRTSNREYVAATFCGSFFFGRLDLIGKGDHGRHVKYCQEKGLPVPPIAYKK